ncbi:MAG: hypothetical protein E7266_03955 [Lachnospiraceae bacterium]|nr:hypothetical protein [Lachnospiraceae bacterium]
MIKKIESELLRLEDVKGEIEAIRKNAPKGKLRCATNKGYYQYYMGKEYIRREKRGYIKKLAQKEYVIELEKKIEEYKKVLEKLKNLYESDPIENVYRNLHPARKQLVEPIIRPVEMIIDEFEMIKYEGKGFDENDKTEFYTIKGERVRSKSEKIIADELYRNGITYKYEMPLELENWNKKITVYPDFTAINKRTGKRWIIEHMGMMDKNSYSENAISKINLYEKNDILLGINLILFYETSSNPININVVRKYINTYLC